MTNIKFIVFKIKSAIIPFCICIFTIFLLIFSNDNLIAAKNGIFMWYNSVLPSLLPFFIATELISYTNIVYFFGKILTPIMRPIFNVPGEGALALILGIISGYPVGAKMVVKLKENGICTTAEAERLLSFTNNSGPLFIIGTVGLGIFLDYKIGIVLLFTHILASLTVGFLFRFWKKNSFEDKKSHKLNFEKSSVSFCNLGEVLSKSIISSINSVVIIGGFIVLFSVIITVLTNSKILQILSLLLNPIFSLLNISNLVSTSLITGMIEVTNGLFSMAKIANISIYFKLYLTSFLLGFGGLSVLLQVLSIISKSKISIKPYFIGKFLQGLIAVIYTSLIL